MTDATWAKITIAVPAIDVNNAFFAVESLSGAPCAYKNKIPVIIQKITTNVVATDNTAMPTLPTITVRVDAKAIFGKIKAFNKIDDNNNFFFILGSLANF